MSTMSSIIITARDAVKSAIKYNKSMSGIATTTSSSNNIMRDRYVDASWYLNNPNRNADDDYKMRRIPGAIRFDIDTIRDTSNEHLSSLPHMLPSPSTINKWLHDNKIDPKKDRLVVYTHPGSFAGPRVWWIFTLYGLNTVYLQGGLIAWEAADGDVQWGWNDDDDSQQHKMDNTMVDGDISLIDEVSAKKAVEDYVATLQYVNSIIHNHHHDNNNNKSIIDARPADRFNGIVAEPRPNLRKGHIPYSINIPFMTVLEPNDVTSFNMDMLLNNNKNMISSLLMGEGKEELIFTCGSGVSAAVLLMANRIANNTNSLKGTKLYDGSWSEWGMPSSNTPVE